MLLGARQFFERRGAPAGGYVAGYTNMIEAWSPTGTGSQTIQLSEALTPLTDFTIDGCMTYGGSTTGDSAILGLNNRTSSTFSLWYRNGNAVPRCFATEDSSNPVATDLTNSPTFCFSIRFNLSALTMTFARGDLTTTHTFSSSGNWTWATAYSQISSGLTVLGMDSARLSDINSIRVYPSILSDADLLANHEIDKARFNLP